MRKLSKALPALVELVVAPAEAVERLAAPDANESATDADAGARRRPRRHADRAASPCGRSVDDQPPPARVVGGQRKAHAAVPRGARRTHARAAYWMPLRSALSRFADERARARELLDALPSDGERERRVQGRLGQQVEPVRLRVDRRRLHQRSRTPVRDLRQHRHAVAGRGTRSARGRALHDRRWPRPPRPTIRSGPIRTVAAAGVPTSERAAVIPARAGLSIARPPPC